MMQSKEQSVQPISSVTRDTFNRNWERTHTAIASRPLTFCNDFPSIARRWEAWWRFEADRPLLIGAVPKRHDIRWDKGFELLGRPAEWLALRRRQLEACHWVDACVPSIRIDLGPVAPAAFLGAELHVAETEQTVWHKPLLENLPATAPCFDPQNRWWRIVHELTRVTARDAAGHYLVCLPDLSSVVDILASLRGTEPLLLDLIDHPEQFLQVANGLIDAWEEMFRGLASAIIEYGAGITTWLRAWSNRPYTVPACDFNALIGPDTFGAVCLPGLEDQSRRVGRMVFHLDGPDAARHADALAASPAIDALQFTPGAGTPSALAQLEMLRRIQAAGKPLLLGCPVNEVPTLAEKLDPRGLALMPDGIRSARQADDLLRILTG